MKAPIKTHKRLFSSYNTNMEMELHLWDAKVATMHGHDFYEFGLCTKGEAREIKNGKADIMKIKDAIFTTPNDYHSLTSQSKELAQHINLSISVVLFNEICADFGLSKEDIACFEKKITLSDEEFNYIMKLFERSFSLDMKKDEKLYRIHLKQMAYSFFHCFLNKSPQGETVPQWLKDFVNKVCSPEYYAYKIKDLYALSNYSQTALSSYFRKYYHTSFVKYFTEAKMTYACNLLKNTNLLIIDISNRLGFSSLSHFNHLFKSMLGCSPTDYRKWERGTNG